MDIINKPLKRRILEISYKHKLSHLGSCLTALDIIKDIYEIKKPTEKFILSAGHAGLALYVVLEKHTGKSAEDIFLHHGVHPDRCTDCGIDCSSGSLGQGLPIAVGMALADRSKNVYCLISDGECSEGSIHEALRIKKEQVLDNLKVYLNFNGFGAYKGIYSPPIKSDPTIFIKRTYVDQLPFLKELDAHYYTMTDADYKIAMEILQ
jgi:transketolase